jgi:hypothetical protein
MPMGGIVPSPMRFECSHVIRFALGVCRVAAVDSTFCRLENQKVCISKTYMFRLKSSVRKAKYRVKSLTLASDMHWLFQPIQ